MWSRCSIFFLRNSRVFSKSRYSRTRQWSKSIVFFGLFLNSTFFFMTFTLSYKFMVLSYVYLLVYCVFLLQIPFGWYLSVIKSIFQRFM